MSDIDTNNIYTQLGLTTPAETDNQPNDELGQADFLELMTAQLLNQDPLEPMENGDFLGQMAQFGTVDGINDLNISMDSLSSSLQSNQALQASTLVGRSVLVPSQSGFLDDGGSLQAAVELEQSATKVVFTVKNTAGQLVYRTELGAQEAGMVDFEWNGLNSDGNIMPAGEYQIEAEVHNGTEVTSGNMFTVVDVESVTLGVGGQDFTLNVSGLGEIDFSQVREIK